jgi:hypothetical protein
MRNRIIRFLNELPTAFSTNELAFYALTNKFELHLRDKLAFRLQSQYPKLQVLREWNNIDISIHKDETIRSLIEIKYSHVAYILRQRLPENIRIMKYLFQDYNKCCEISNNWHGILFLSCPKKKISVKYKKQVKRYSTLNKYSEHYRTERQWRVNIKKIIVDYFFDEKQFRVKSNTLNIGSWFETPVDLIWFLISAK